MRLHGKKSHFKPLFPACALNLETLLRNLSQSLWLKDDKQCAMDTAQAVSSMTRINSNNNYEKSMFRKENTSGLREMNLR